MKIKGSTIGVGVGFLTLVFAPGPVYRWLYYDSQEEEPASVQLRRKNFEPIEKSRLFRDIDFTFWNESGITFGPFCSDNYFNDTAAYEFAPSLSEQLAQATFDLHNMCLDAVDTVVSSEDLMDLFEIPESLQPEIKRSWKKREADMIGRFDFLIDANNIPKLIEYNADTPTLLLESSKAQGIWAKEKSLSGRQFNFLIGALEFAWRQVVNIVEHPEIYFLAVNSLKEESENLNVLCQTAHDTGFKVEKRDISDLKVGVNGELKVMMKDIDCFWKLYPWEWLANEDLIDFFKPSNRARQSKTKVLEPAWKAVLSNKSLLVVLWQLYPNHPNLVPAFFSIPTTYSEFENNMFENSQYKWIAKPKFGRGGEKVIMSTEFSSLKEFLQKTGAGDAYIMEQSDDPELAQKLSLGDYVIQQYVDSPTHRGRYATVGSWVVFGAPVGFCIREDKNPIIKEYSSFVPSYIGGTEGDLFSNFDPHPFSSSQRKLRQELYGKAGNQLLNMIFKGKQKSETEYWSDETYRNQEDSTEDSKENTRRDSDNQSRRENNEQTETAGGIGGRSGTGGGSGSTGGGGGGYVPYRHHWYNSHTGNSLSSSNSSFNEKMLEAKNNLKERAKKINQARRAQGKSTSKSRGASPRATGSTGKTFGRAGRG